MLRDRVTTSARNPEPSDRKVLAAVVMLGVTSTATQVVVLREFISVVDGNELVIGIVLATWMLLTGAGSFGGLLAKRLRHRREFLPWALISLSLLPVLTVFLLRFLRNLIFTPGSMIGMVQALLASFAILTPFCLLSGFLFVIAASLLPSRPGKGLIGTVYSWESLGSMAGGIAFNIVLAAFCDACEILSLVFALDLAAFCLFLAPEDLPRTARIALLVSGLVASAVAFFTLDPLTRGFLYPGQEVVYSRDTPYGNLTITRQREQLNFFENSLLMFSTNDVIVNEENVHYAMVQRPGPRRVLLMGGGISGTIREIFKYDVDSVDYVEVNPWVIRIGRHYTSSLSDGRINVTNDDARMHIRTTNARYGAALVNLPDPGTAQLNRYYSREFFQELKRVLEGNGVLSISLLPATDYQGTEARKLSSILYATLRGVFDHVLIIPGGRNYFLASDGALDVHIARRIEQRGVPTAYVNRYYLDDALVERRSDAIRATLDTLAVANTDFRPVCYERQMSYWLSYFGFDPRPWIIMGAILVGAVLLWRPGAVDAGIFAAGFTASSIEIILLVSFQIMYGSLFQMTGVVIAAFMTGLAAGSFVAGLDVRRSGIDRFIMIQAASAIMCVLFPVALGWLQTTGASRLPGNIVFVAFAFLVALIIGMEFAVASVVRRGSVEVVASRLYGLDLLGSAVGAVLVSVFVIPLFGVTTASVVAGSASAAGAFVCLVNRGKFVSMEGYHA